MSYRVKYDDISNTGYAANGQLSQMDALLAEVKQALKSIAELDSFQGRTATNIKDYIKEVHYTLLSCIGEVTAQYRSHFLLYKDGYYRQIDNDNHAELFEEVFSEIIRIFPNSKYAFDTQSSRVNNTLGSISDIISLSNPSPMSVDGDYDKIYKRVYELKEKVGTYEATHRGDLKAFDDLLAALQNSIREWMGKTYAASTYQAGSIMAASSTAALGQALEQSYFTRQELAAQLDQALTDEVARLEVIEQELADERLRQGILDAMTATLIIVGAAACIILTAGMATPLVVAGVVAGGSALIYGCAELYEAGENIKYGVAGDPYAVAFNPIRDTVFAGNQQAYDTWGTVSVIATSVVSIGAGGISAASTATKAGTSTLQAVGVYGGKTVLSFGAGIGAEKGTVWAASNFTDDTTAQIIGRVAGIGSGFAVGGGLNKLDRTLNLSGYYSPRVTNPDYLNEFGKVKWKELAPGDGYVLDDNGLPIKNSINQKVGDQFDRYGYTDGRYTSPIENGKPFSFSERSLPFEEIPQSYNKYEVIRDFNELPDAIRNCPNNRLKSQIIQNINEYWGGSIDDISVYSGEAAKAFAGTGGAIQWEMPLSIKQLVGLGMIKDITVVNYLNLQGFSDISNALNILQQMEGAK